MNNILTDDAKKRLKKLKVSDMKFLKEFFEEYKGSDNLWDTLVFDFLEVPRTKKN